MTTQSPPAASTPAAASPFRLYNTLSREVEPFKPQLAGHVKLYVCGVTVYDESHIGHARAMVVFDTVVRYLRYRGWAVDFVRNFTDVDDKIIRRAGETGEAPLALAARYIEAFRRDARGLGLIQPDHEPTVSGSMNEIIAFIGDLVASGHAYVQDGNVWYDVASFADYGKLSNQRGDDLRNEDSGNKRSPRDFALWKTQKGAELAWDSPWGPGRPGWHIECSAMCRKHLGNTLDIHGGGLDLVFPHHENEIAQSEAANKAPFASYWMHNGLLVLDGGKKAKAHDADLQPVKMGKSLGNVVQIRELVESYPAEAIRLYYLQTHYRSPLPWTPEAMDEALAMLSRLYEAREAAEGMGGDGDGAQIAKEVGGDAKVLWDLGQTFAERLHAAMDEDFNSSQALGHAFELARAINRCATSWKKAKAKGGPLVAPALAGLKLLGPMLGLLTLDSVGFQEQVKAKRLGALGVDRAAVEATVAERINARNAKDWARADALRLELEAKSIVVMDRENGTSDWKIRLKESGS
jgi:cysteinyl-tRNA synthetase